ncbi:MAG: LPS export ABC transporter periplasmic protein LptC [Rhodospirillaceae bacterium]
MGKPESGRGAALTGWLRRQQEHAGYRTLSKRHSRIVLALKIGLPLLAALMISLIFVWPRLSMQNNTGKIDKNQTSLVNARYFSHDRQNLPFSMLAKSATEVPGMAQLLDLVQPEAEMTRADGSWLTISSERGRYNQDDARLLMLDNVHVLRDDGFEFVTDEAEIDTKTGNAWGNHKVVGQGPSGEIRAEGFVATDHGQTITFTRSSKAAVQNGGVGKTAPAAKGNPK